MFSAKDKRFKLMKRNKMFTNYQGKQRIETSRLRQIKMLKNYFDISFRRSFL